MKQITPRDEAVLTRRIAHICRLNKNDVCPKSIASCPLGAIP